MARTTSRSRRARSCQPGTPKENTGATEMEKRDSTDYFSDGERSAGDGFSGVVAMDPAMLRERTFLVGEYSHESHGVADSPGRKLRGLQERQEDDLLLLPFLREIPHRTHIFLQTSEWSSLSLNLTSATVLMIGGAYHALRQYFYQRSKRTPHFYVRES